MSDAINDGGPAFPMFSGKPVPGGGIFYDVSGGMSLRDWFATNAPAMPDWWRQSEVRDTSPPGWTKGMTASDWDRLCDAFRVERMVSWRWHYADAMIAARSKGGAQ